MQIKTDENKADAKTKLEIYKNEILSNLQKILELKNSLITISGFKFFCLACNASTFHCLLHPSDVIVDFSVQAWLPKKSTSFSKSSNS